MGARYKIQISVNVYLHRLHFIEQILHYRIDVVGIVAIPELLKQGKRLLTVVFRINIGVVCKIVVIHFLCFTLKGYVCKLFVAVCGGVHSFFYKLSADNRRRVLLVVAAVYSVDMRTA